MMMMRVNFQGACVLNCMQISNTRVISMASVVLPSPSPPVRLKEANQTYIIYPLWISLSKPTTYFTKTILNPNLADSVDATDATSINQHQPASTSINQWTILPGGLWRLWPILMETSYYVGAEPKNAVQSEKFWRNRIDAEEVPATRSLQLLRGDGIASLPKKHDRPWKNSISPHKSPSAQNNSKRVHTVYRQETIAETDAICNRQEHGSPFVDPNMCLSRMY